MAISINTVYQRVLALANKEQRGYITPQEFNLYANQAQLEILNQYFYDTSQFGRASGNDTEYGDMLEFIHEKVNMLTTNVNLAQGNGNFFVIPQDAYKVGTITHVLDRVSTEIEPVNENEYVNMSSSPLTSPTLSNPVYVTVKRTISNLPRKTIDIYPFNDLVANASNIRCSYVQRPQTVNWAYVVVSGKALYNMNASVDFELHDSEESNLVYRILALAGITLADTGVNVYQASTAEEQKKVIQQKR
jgi:hypothetical protein